jgi:hypothetical protein
MIKQAVLPPPTPQEVKAAGGTDQQVMQAHVQTVTHNTGIAAVKVDTAIVGAGTVAIVGPAAVGAVLPEGSSAAVAGVGSKTGQAVAERTIVGDPPAVGGQTPPSPRGPYTETVGVPEEPIAPPRGPQGVGEPGDGSMRGVFKNAIDLFRAWTGVPDWW